MSHERLLRFADFVFDPESGELTAGCTTTRLSFQPALILSTLVGRPGKVVTRDELQAIVWGDGTCVDYDQSLNFCIREIRRALGDSPRGPRFIETLPKRGYRWIAPIHPFAPPNAKSRPRWALAAAVAASLTFGALLGHELAASPLHDRAIEWTHRVLAVSPGACPFAKIAI